MGVVQRDSIINSIITYFGIGLGYLNKGLLFPILLTPNELGLVNVSLLLAGFFAQFADLGSGLILLRFLPIMKGEKGGFSGILRYGLRLLMIGSIAVTLLFFLSSNLLSDIYSENAPQLVHYLWWIVPMGLSIGLYNVFEHYLRALSDNIVSLLIRDFVLRLIILVLLCFYYFDVIGIELFIILFFIAHIFPSLGLFIYIVYKKKLFVAKKYYTIRKRLEKVMTHYGLFVYMNTIGRNIMLIADVSMLTAMKGLEVAGIFTLMVFITNALFVPYVSLVRITSPLVPRLWNERNTLELSKLYESVSSIGYFVTVAFFIPVWFNFDLIISFFPSEYEEGKYVLLFLMIGRMFEAIGGLNGFILMTSKKFKLELWLTIPLIIATFYLNYLLIPDYGGVGAAIATSFIYLAYNGIRLILNYYYFKLSPFTPKFVLSIILGSLILLSSFIIPEFENMLFDVLLRRISPTLLFVFIMLYFNLSPGVNSFLLKFKNSIFKKNATS